MAERYSEVPGQGYAAWRVRPVPDEWQAIV